MSTMAGGMDLGGSRDGKKPLDAVINLVPFIDLMAVTIAFLLITAVWTQAGRLEVSSPGQGGGETSEAPLTLRLSAQAVTVVLGATAMAPIPLGELERLDTRLRQIKAEEPSRASVTVEAEDSVRYEDLVRVIDACRAARIEGVAVTPTG